MTKKKNSKDKKQPWSIPLRAREELYNGINPSAGFGIGSFLTQGAGYLGGFRTGLGMNEDEARWAAYLGLPYDKEYAPDTKIRFEHDKNYPDRQYQGVSKRAKNEIREEVIPEAKRIKDEYGKEWIQVLDERGIFGNDSTIYHPRETYTGDLGKFGIREVGNSGIYEIGDKYDFPALIPIPNRNEGTELMVRDTIWSDRANPKLYNQEVMKRKNKFYDGGLKVEMPDFSNLKLEAPKLTGGLKSTISTLGNKIGGALGGISGGIANTAATAIGGLLAGGKESGVGNAMQKLGSLASNIPGVGGLIGAGVNLAGGLINATFGSKLNKEEIAKVEGQIGNLKSFTSDASDYDSLASNYTSMPVIDYFSKDDIGSDGVFSNKAEDKWEELKKEKLQAELWVHNSLSNNAQNIATNKQQLLEANYTAYGGPINMKYTGTMSPFGNQFDEGGPLNPYSAGALVDAIYSTFKREKYLGKPSHNYDFTIPEEEANKLGYYPDERGHRDDRVKKPTHPTHPSRGKWKSFEEFELTDRGMENPNYILFGLNDGGQDPQAVMTYNGGIVLPEITVTPKGSYIMNPYDNIKIFNNGGSLEGENSSTNNKAKNKWTFIGGTKSETRKKYFNLDKELTQVVTNLATSYGISPALVIDRLAHEGIIDRLINDHNAHVKRGGEERPSRAFSTNIFNSPYGLFGLDYIFDTYTKGVTKTKRPINFRRMPTYNESGERVNSGDTNNIYDTLELFTAELASRREQVKKQYPNLTDAELDSATAARYNASNKYFKQLMDSGEYKTKYPIDVEGVNIPTPTKTDSKYIQDQVQSINKSTVLRDFKDYHYHGNDRSYLIDGSVFTVGNKSYNPGLFIDKGNHEFKSDSPLVDRFIDNYVNRNYTIPSKVKVVDDYYENKKANGGNLFTNGVTTIGNGGTHEYLEGQEYDVTEDEIKLLKKLGYEFEYL